MTHPNDQPEDGPLIRTTARRVGDGILMHAVESAANTALALVVPPDDAAVPPPPSGAVLHPPAANLNRQQWFPIQLWNEVRLTGRMYYDPHYRISRTAQFLLPAILGLFVLNYFFFAVWLSIPVVSPILERAICVLLGVFTYKVMTRELARYREVLDYLTRYGHR